jgi:mono/diheme cytochrome c family protein
MSDSGQREVAKSLARSIIPSEHLSRRNTGERRDDWRPQMQRTRLTAVVGIATLAACASAGPNVRTPLGAHLTTGATTGAQLPLRFDPNAKVILSSAAGLPPASYLNSQAARGQHIYEETCGTCHQSSQFVGPAFVESWNDRRLYDFYALVRGTMPLDKPGGLKEGEYLDVVSYLLKANHAPAGLDSLKADTVALRKTRIAVTP